MDKPRILVPHNPAWEHLFKTERNRIATALDEYAVRIEHVGSTAIPRVAAKPVIDIQVSVGQLHPINRYASPLQQLGYRHRSHPDDAFCPFFHRPSAWPHTHHIHAVEAGSKQERHTLAFRDYLRDNPPMAEKYEELKLSLAERYSMADISSRHAYAEAKGDFIERIIETALTEGYPNSE